MTAYTKIILYLYLYQILFENILWARTIKHTFVGGVNSKNKRLKGQGAPIEREKFQIYYLIYIAAGWQSCSQLPKSKIISKTQHFNKVFALTKCNQYIINIQRTTFNLWFVFLPCPIVLILYLIFIFCYKIWIVIDS